MILDLHTHSIASDDGRAKVENYCQWIERKSLPLDGFVLTEHRQFDEASDYRALEEAKRCGAIAVPCHPGRPKVGLCAHWEIKGPVDGVHTVETLNGGSREGENEQAADYANRFGWNRTGGSDSHIVSHIGRFATQFEDELTNIDDLVAALRSGRFDAIQPKLD